MLFQYHELSVYANIHLTICTLIRVPVQLSLSRVQDRVAFNFSRSLTPMNFGRSFPLAIL